MSNIDKRALREVAERATPGNWRRTSSLFNGITVTPFSLCGEEVTLAHTVEKRDAEFIAAANPATMLALLDELEAKEEQRANWFRMAQKLGEDLDTAERLIAELDQRLIEYAGIATREAHRVAELEARTVILPEPIIVLHRRDFTDAHREIYAYPEAEVNAALADAGIGVKGE
ncbi:TPA: ead/Ea22-like family protein [Salmonella enterica]|nr:ead/Ea22-like family protein [Salmonella enterica]HAK7090077.1 ead/Ea22-like family protein [Salmonella enterica]